MVSEGARPWGRGRSGDCEKSGVGVDWGRFEDGGSFLLTTRSFLLTVGLCYLRWSLLLTVEIRFGLLYSHLKFGLVFFAHGGKLVWSFLLTVPLVQEIGFGLLYLRFPHRK